MLQKISVIWQNIGIVQRAMLAAVLVAVALVGVLFTYWAKMPDMKVLYSDLAPEEAAKITDKINEQSIAYKLNSSGTTIYVPKQYVSQLRLDMAKEGLPGTGQKGYGLFDDEKVGISPFVQNVNLQRALQDELAKSIQMIDGVTQARVHIVSPENTLFNSQKTPTTASVVLRLHPGYQLSRQNVAAISHIVTGSVENLKAEHITIVDTQGRLLSGGTDETVFGSAGTVADYKERVEHRMAEKVQTMLETVLGAGRATVNVSAEIDMTSKDMAREIYDDGKRVATKEEVTNEKEIENTKDAEEKIVPGTTKTNETIVTEFLVPKTIEKTVEMAGEITSVTVAAFVDLSPVEVPVAEGEQAPAEADTTPIMEISQVEEIIKRAIGPKLAEDGLKVVNVKFNHPAPMPVEAEAGGLDYIQIARQGSLGIMAICALIVLKIFSGSSKKASAQASEQLPAIGAGQMAGLLPSPGMNVSESSLLRQQIARSLQNNPDQVKQLFSSWLQEKGS